ncbi:MAG: hypothetical protein PHQ91_09245 [Thermoanaerobaculaceae bacterium]|nr:hypothetical protein [Thermoanaerobaculaceae bacterium]TAM56449.1 MAG: hypothetical protein EPN53_01900 [Acidobacteriota bacterium]
MKPVVIALIVIGVAAGVAAIWLAERAWWKRRRERWAAAAVELGLAVADGPELLDRFGSLPLFQKGRDRRVRNLVRGSAWGPEVWIADYVYVTGGGKSQQQHRATVCILRDAKLALPRFELAPEDPISHRLGPLFGIREVGFDDDPAFSKTYRVVGPDEAAVRAAFTQGVRSQFVQRATRVAHVEAEGDAMLVHTGRLIDPGTARDLLQLAQEVRSYFG